MSLAITGVSVGGPARLAYPVGPILPYADPRAIGIASPPAGTPPSAGSDIALQSESVRDRVTLSTRVRQSPLSERTERRKQPFAVPTTRKAAARTLSDLAEEVTDRVTFTRRQETAGARRATYSKSGKPAAAMSEAASPELDALAAAIADQVTLTAPDRAAEAAEITVYIGGKGDAEASRAGVPPFGLWSPAPAAG
jgi:hypothetical protein